jgi:hypothetical protein
VESEVAANFTRFETASVAEESRRLKRVETLSADTVLALVELAMNVAGQRAFIEHKNVGSFEDPMTLES